MEKFASMVLVFALGLSLSACSKDSKSDSEGAGNFAQKIESVKRTSITVDAEDGWWEEYGISSDEVILVASHSNYADVHIFFGSFVTANGNVYDFDFSELAMQNDFDMVESMKEVAQNSKPVDTLDLGTTKGLFVAGYDVDASVRYDFKNLACDAGGDHIKTYVKGKGLTQIFEVGDNYGFYHERGVGAIVRFCYENFTQALRFESWFDMNDLP